MRKKALLALLLVMALFLSGCTLIVKDEAVDAATPILTLGDTVVTKGEVVPAVNTQLNYMSYYYGYDPSDPEVVAMAQDAVVNSLKRDLVLRAKSKELGFDVLTEEEENQVRETGEADYNEDVEYVKKSYFADSELEGEALDNAAKEQMEEMGRPLSFYIDNARTAFIDNKLKDSVIKDIAVTDEEVEAEYNSRVEADREKYTDNAGAWAVAATSTTSRLYYTPAGVRRVKQILLAFQPEDAAAISEARKNVTTAQSAVTAAQGALDALGPDDDRTQAEADLAAANADLEAANAALTAAIDTAFAHLDAEADAIVDELAAGGDWDALMAEKNQDPGMQPGAPNAEKGYAVAAGMTNFDPAFVEAAMAIPEVGGVSGKVRGENNGYYIIRYVADEPEGPVALDTVREEIHTAMLTARQNEAYNAAVTEWVEAAPVKVDMNALKD